MKRPPPCAGCEYGRPPELLSENEDAWELWLGVATQWRSAGFSILGLDYPCLYQEAARLGIELTARTMRKIKALEQCVLESLNGDEKAKSKEHRA